MDSDKLWRIYFLIGILIAIIVAIYIGNRLLDKKKADTIPELDPTVTKFVSFWYAETEDSHLILQPYSFNAHTQKYNVDSLNQTLDIQSTYFILRIIHFHIHPVCFDDRDDMVSVILKNGKIYNSIPISPMVSKAPFEKRLWLETMCGKTLFHENSIVVDPSLPEREINMQKYLIAFSAIVNFQDIQEVRITWNNVSYILDIAKNFKSCMRRNFDEYLHNPTLAFWKQSDA